FGTASRQSRSASGMQAALAEADTFMASSPTAEAAGSTATRQRPTNSAFRKDMLVLPDQSSGALWLLQQDVAPSTRPGFLRSTMPPQKCKSPPHGGGDLGRWNRSG